MKSTKKPSSVISSLFTKTALILLALCFLEFSERKAADPEINTPDEALNELIYGNNRFLDNAMIYTDYHEQIQKTKNGQHPHSFVLSCIDSRVPPEIILDQGIGHLFVARVAGNVEDDNILGSMEYAVEVKHTKLIVVLGHSHCGAVQGAIDNVELEHLTQLTEQIKPAFSKHITYPIPEHVAEETSRQNVKLTMKHIYENSATIKRLVNAGKVKIVGAYYDIQTGEVNFFKK
ncbi:carbonic anhydrase [Flavobacterium suncheonense]|uniref:carbonic anhydrase n=1 Tax=Flavobacterium suncheonense TaxID=350894 RepID=UPI0004132A85|nr:carbonic anhydrase [Flavobacterium suncheonense]